ncbi:MAG TPA: transketolase C-terminal domain-containing protein [Candidatus Methylomirabilis sp.]|jgi:pyruvate ferredoxin oxidoreductase alpha subunit|nr:transketolase C-terminal domain-containing protein [Candidatus Methylomirabilis sp.]
MATVELLTSNQAAGQAVRLARVQVIPIYPITPQSTMLGEIVRDIQMRRVTCEFVSMESDYAAMAAAIGASLGGTRVFTATNSQGLLFMAEHLYTASGSRCPIVMAVVNRGISVPHTRYADHNDALGVSRAGWIQVFCEDAQDVLETCLQLYRVCEDRRVRLPGMFCYESFIHSNTAEGVAVPDAGAVERWLGPPRVEALLDPADPRGLNPPTPPEWYTEFKYAEHLAMARALTVLPEVAASYAEAFQTRPRALLTCTAGPKRCVVVTMGSMVKAARRAVKELQADGVPAGLCAVRVYRPFPVEALREAVGEAEVVVALDRNCASGAHGALYEEVRSALYGLPKPPRVVGVIGGLAGRDVTVSHIKDLVQRAARRSSPFDGPDGAVHWLGLVRERVRDESPQFHPAART